LNETYQFLTGPRPQKLSVVLLGFEGGCRVHELPEPCGTNLIRYLYEPEVRRVDCGGFVSFLCGKKGRSSTDGIGLMNPREWTRYSLRDSVFALAPGAVIGMTTEQDVDVHRAMSLGGNIFLSKLGDKGGLAVMELGCNGALVPCDRSDPAQVVRLPTGRIVCLFHSRLSTGFGRAKSGLAGMSLHGDGIECRGLE
jgi:hypothetical protein